MREYQEKYIENLRRVLLLNAPPGEIPADPAAYVKQRDENVAEIRRISEENTAMLRQELFPLLDNIVSAGEEDISNLEDFAAQLLQRGTYLDLVLCYSLHNALITYARHWEYQDLLIRELYHCAMALFYMQEIVRRAGQSPYRWKMSMMFGEAASYIKQYDDIYDEETRGYIHRAMGNLALVYSELNAQDGRRKMNAIRRSLQILEDPVYHEKSPGLPWDLYLYKSHQERTTGLGLLRAGIVDPQVQREVMESAEYVFDRLMESCQTQSAKPAMRWRYAYEAAHYHCGVRPLSYFLGWMEQEYMERDEQDYSSEGIYCNMFLPALYAAYIEDHGEYRHKKKEVLSLMYRRLAVYVRKMPDNQISETTINHLLACLQTFVEYPDGIQEKDFIINLVVCRNPDAFVTSRMSAEVARMLVDRAVDSRPEALAGTLGCASPEEVSAHREEFRRFAYEGCLLHNVGLLAFTNFVRRIGRSWLEEEESMYRCHVEATASLLERSESTRPYVQAALGHHRYYNGQGGYPQRYSREEDPNASMTDLVSAAIHLVRLIDNPVFLSSPPMTLDQAMVQIEKDAGVRLSPVWAHMLIALEPEIREYLKEGRVNAYEEAFELLRGDIHNPQPPSEGKIRL